MKSGNRTPDAPASSLPHLAREQRELRFWDEQVASFEDSLRQYHAGPDPNTRAVIDAIEPLEQARVLDLGCGSGVLSAWLAKRGALVTGIDLSPTSVEHARELAETLGLDAEFLCGSFPGRALDGRSFSRIAGRFVLHHLDLSTAAPALAQLLEVGGRAAFLETMASNPLLTAARGTLVGRLGIPRYGTEDERPLRREDLDTLVRNVGPLHIEVAEMRFLGILDRQVFGYRSQALSRIFAKLDDGLLAIGLTGASYHQVLVLTRVVEHE